MVCRLTERRIIVVTDEKGGMTAGLIAGAGAGTDDGKLDIKTDDKRAVIDKSLLNAGGGKLGKRLV